MKNLFLFTFLSMLYLDAHAIDWATSGTKITEGGELHYRIAGEGRTLLLLHGYSGYGNQWHQFLPAFTNNYRVIAVDLPGHGQSTAVGKEFNVANAARDMWQLLDQLDVDTIHGIGYSAGGMTLLQMALQQPQRVEEMVLAASAIQIPEAASRGEFEQLSKDYQKDLLRNHNGDMEKIRSMLSAKFVADMDVDDLKNLQVPTLVLSGDRDKSFPLQVVVDTYSTLPNAKLWVYPGVGHSLFWPWGGSERLAKQLPEEVERFFNDDQ